MRAVLCLLLMLVAPHFVYADDGSKVSRQVARLQDAPAATFSTSGWGYSNTANPFLLTPDYLTNAMIGVSRLEKGQSFLRGPARVPANLDVDGIRAAMAERLKDKPRLALAVESIGNYQVVVARYGDGTKESLEYAFEFEQHLVHLLLVARTGDYFEQGQRVARKVVETFAPL